MATIQTLNNSENLGTHRSKLNTNFTNLNSDKAETSAVLTKTNVTAFVPSANYHPATKLYVDTINTNIRGDLDPNGYAVDAFARANHTGTQAATTITEDATHRFATDAEKATWNAKEPAIAKNTAFNKDFGTTHVTVAYGDHAHAATYVALVVGPTVGNFASLTAPGGISDSGYDETSFALANSQLDTGGSTDQRWAKASGTNYDMEWQNPSVDYRDITTKTGTSEIATSTWAGSFVKHTPTNTATLTLPQTSTESLGAGFNFWYTNTASSYNVTLATQGTDTLNINDDVSIVYPGETAFIVKSIAGSPNTWECHIVRSAVQEKITADSITLSVGSSSDALADLQTAYDGNFYTLTEANAVAPAMNLIVDFVSVDCFKRVGILGGYIGAATHAVSIQVYNWTNTRWDVFNASQHGYANIADADEYCLDDLSFEIKDCAEYVGTGGDAGEVRIRFYHTPTGNSSHELYLDEVALYK